MKLSSIVKGIHYNFIYGFTLFSIFILRHQHLYLTISLISIMLFIWIVHKKCIIKDYEYYLSTAYDFQKKQKPKKYKWYHYLVINIILFLLLFRYYYQYNLVECEWDYQVVQLFITMLLLLFILLIVPAIEHVQLTKKYRLFILFFISLFINLYYFIILNT